jgi:ribonuclease E
VAGSTRLEAKRQRRRDGRDTGRRRAPILTEAEFLARREAVDRKMVIRQRGERTQIAVLEDDVLVEHYVTQAQATSFAGNVYLGRVQNVLPSMEAAFVDIGKGRNAVLYAGEVNWDAAGLSGKQRSIETALKSGDKVLVQVTKDPIGHKGARLTQQINLPGRFLVYVPGGSMTGISRKLPDTERQRLKDILKKIVPEDAGVIIRTAAEGASEEELTRDVNRLTAQWEVIQKKAESTSNAPTLLYGEPDLAIRVIRDVFNEDFKELVVQGDDAWDTVEAYVAHVSPELTGRLTALHRRGRRLPRPADRRAAGQGARPQGVAALGRLAGHRPHRGDDRRRRQHRQVRRLRRQPRADRHAQQHGGRGGDRPPAPAARHRRHHRHRLHRHGAREQPRPRAARLTECLGRDRTKHQVAEVTSLGLVQMTRKRVGQGLLEVFSEPCEHCRGRGVIVSTDPVDERRRSGGSGGGNGGAGGGNRRERSGGPRDVKEAGSRDVEAPAAEDAAPVESGLRGRRGGRRRPHRQPPQPRTSRVAVRPARTGPPRTPRCSPTANRTSSPTPRRCTPSEPAVEEPAADGRGRAGHWTRRRSGPRQPMLVEIVPALGGADARSGLTGSPWTPGPLSRPETPTEARPWSAAPWRAASRPRARPSRTYALAFGVTKAVSTEYQSASGTLVGLHRHGAGTVAGAPGFGVRSPSSTRRPLRSCAQDKSWT